MAVVNAQNLEDAAALAWEFIYGMRGLSLA